MWRTARRLPAWEVFLGEEADHREVDYFQGLEQFREQKLSHQLSAAESDKLLDHSILNELQQTLRTLKLKGAPSSAVNEAKTQLSTYRAALERETLLPVPETMDSESKN